MPKADAWEGIKGWGERKNREKNAVFGKNLKRFWEEFKKEQVVNVAGRFRFSVRFRWELLRDKYKVRGRSQVARKALGWSGRDQYAVFRGISESKRRKIFCLVIGLNHGEMGKKFMSAGGRWMPGQEKRNISAF